MVLNAHRNHKGLFKLLRTGRRGGGGGRSRLYTYCHHQNDFCIKIGSDENHFNVSLIVRDKVTRQCPQTTTFGEKGEPKRYRTEVLVLTSLKPVLNWANVCSPNISRTVRRTMIHFLIELLVRRIWFGQFDKLYFVLIWLVMRCKLRPELAADAQQTA